MSAIDDTVRALKSLNNLPNYVLRKVKQYCPVDNNVDVPASGRLRRSFKAIQTGPASYIIESDSPYLQYVVHGRGAIWPRNAKHLRWNAFGHGNGSWFPSHGGTGYFFSGHAKATGPNPFIDKAWEDVMAHISNRSLNEIANELNASVISDGQGILLDNVYQS